MDNNIREIQDLYRDEEQKKKLKKRNSRRRGSNDNQAIQGINNQSKTTESSFIQDKIKNLEQHMKFIHFLIQTRLFKLPPHYQSLYSRGEQNPEF